MQAVPALPNKRYKCLHRPPWPPGGLIPDVQTVMRGNNKFDKVSCASRVHCLKMKRRQHYQSDAERRKIVYIVSNK